MACRGKSVERFPGFFFTLTVSNTILWTLIISSTSNADNPGLSSTNKNERPEFVVEPPNLAEFSNSTGIQLECKAKGKPQPTITWLLTDGSSVNHVHGLRHLAQDGSLVFPPFKAEDYRQDVHSVTYRCSASNAVGTVISRDVTVRGVVLQPYEVYVYDVYVIKNNTAVFRCHVPALLMEYVRVTSWIMDESFIINKTDVTSDTKDFKYLLTSTGELYVRNASMDDVRKTFRCSTVHELTGQLRLSSSSGRLIVTDPRMSVLPRITDQRSEMSATSGETVFIRCVAEGHPPPRTEWYIKESRDRMSPIPKTKKYRILPEGLLIKSVTRDDSGVYSCIVTNVIGLEKAETTLSITEPLNVSVLSEVVKSDVGSNLKVQCDVRGYPVTSIYWIKDGRQTDNMEYVTSAGNMLIITSVRSSHRGMWQCFAKNSVMSSHRSFELVLGDAPPEFVTVFEESLLHVGSQHSMACAASGTPTPEIKWNLDGISITNVKGRITDDGTVFSWLNISSVRTEDSGVYMCKAINKAGSVQFSARINVYGKLAARQRPQLSAISGQDTIIDCPVIGYPIENIIWQKGGIMLPIDVEQEIMKNGTLLIKKVQRSSDAGEYTCIASNGQGDSVTGTVKVAVIVPPKITPFGFPEDVRDGMRVSIACIVSEGDMPLSIKWVKDGESILSTHGVTVREIDVYSSMLAITSIKPQHNGNYTCIASNNAATATHTSTLAVNVDPKISPFTFQEENTVLGSFARISCLVYQGDLPLRINWMKDNRELPRIGGISARMIDDYSSMLSIDRVQLDHAGNYTCIASNDAGFATHTAKLVVHVPPRWHIVPQNTTVKVGDTILIHCQADGFPLPTIEWMKVEGNTPSGVKYRLSSGKDIALLSNYSLKIFKATTEHQGFYFCIADNGVGKGLSKAVYVKVQAPVFFHETHQDIAVKIGTSASLHCEAFGDHPITFIWSHKNKILNIDRHPRIQIKVINDTHTESVTSALTINTVLKNDSGEFGCRATNLYGSATTKINLIVKETPEIPEVLVIKNLGDRSVELSWNTPFDGNSGIIQYLLQYKRKQDSWQARSTVLEIEGTTTSRVVKGLQPATVYEFRVAAENSVGRSGYSNVVTVALGEEAPEGPPLHVEVEAVDPDVLRISWKPPKKNLWNGAIRGYYVGYKVVDSPESYSFTMLEVPEDYTEDLIYQITDLKRYTQYSVIVQAYNNGGKGPSSEEIIAMTSEDVPRVPPQEVRCSPLSSHSIYVVWDPPLPEEINGILRGFKVYYKPAEELYDGSLRSNVTQLPRQTLHKLDVNRNYSIQVSSFTRVGESVKSAPVYCKTHEDVPGPPDAIKALPSSYDSVLVTWRAPSKPNGIIIKYNVYYKLHGGGHEDAIGYTYSGDDSNRKDELFGVSVHNLDPTFTYFEVKRLQRNRRYAFWVTAISSIGEGPSSVVVTQSPATAYVPAKSASFDERINMPWKRDLLLACRAVGIPTPKRTWKKGTHTVRDNERMKIHFDGTLLIKDTDDLDSGNYTCRVENQYGQDEVQYTVIIQVPPPIPVLNVVSKSLTSINLQWKIDGDGGDPIRGFILHYKREDGQWDRQDIPSNINTYTLYNLSCGAAYMIYLTAYNSIGVGPPCDTETVTTQGEAFYQPSKDAIIREGATFVTVHLDMWPDTGCPVQYFTADYKTRTAEKWTNIPTNYRPSNKKLVISGLTPSTWYNLRLTAHTSGEPNVAPYEFATLSQTGGTIPPNTFQKEEKIVYFYLDPWIFIPLVALIITIIIASIVVCIFMKRRNNNRGNTTVGVIPTNWPPDDGTLARSRPELGVSVESFVHLQRGAGNTLGRPGTLRRNREDPSPYASVQVSSYPTNPDMMMQLMEKISAPPPLPPCPENLPPGRDKKWISEEDMFCNDHSGFGFHNNWDQGYSSADGENIYATATRPPFGSLPNTADSHLIPQISNLPTEETTFVFPNKPNESGIHPGIRDQTNCGRPREITTPENAWLLDDRYPNPHKEDIY